VLRVLAAASLVSAWLVLLLAGWTAGGLVWLLLPAGLALVPWRALADPASDGEARAERPDAGD
jgi:hypothetical protein